MKKTTNTTHIARALVSCIVAVLVAALPAPAHADVKQGFRIHDGNWDGVKKTFEPIPGENPYSVPVQQFTYENCEAGKDPAAAQQYMQLIRIVVNNSVENGHTTHLTLTWPDPDQNSMSLTLYNKEKQSIANGAPREEGETHPQEIHYTDLQNDEYYVCVANLFGQNKGYTLTAVVTADFSGFNDGSTPQPTDSPARTESSPTRTPRPTPAAAGAPASISGPTPTPELVTTPGPDGAVSEKDLPLVAAGRQGRPLDESNTTGLVFLLFTVAIAVGGSAFVALKIRRERV